MLNFIAKKSKFLFNKEILDNHVSIKADDQIDEGLYTEKKNTKISKLKHG
jgi:hypothetical protein